MDFIQFHMYRWVKTNWWKISVAEKDCTTLFVPFHLKLQVLVLFIATFFIHDCKSISQVCHNSPHYELTRILEYLPEQILSGHDCIWLWAVTTWVTVGTMPPLMSASWIDRVIVAFSILLRAFLFRVWDSDEAAFFSALLSLTVNLVFGTQTGCGDSLLVLGWRFWSLCRWSRGSNSSTSSSTIRGTTTSTFSPFSGSILSYFHLASNIGWRRWISQFHNG